MKSDQLVHVGAVHRRASLVRSLRKMRPAHGLFALAVGALLTACAHVAPYERAQMAHPTMTTDDLARPAEQHVRAVQEGAAGGGFSAGGGCGCN